MANELAGVLTDLGAYLIEQAYQAGEVVQITEMALGDGGGSEVIVSPDVTELVGEFHRQLLDNGPDEDSALGGSINYIPLPEHAGKWLREFGLYDSLGNLIVYAASSPAQLPENPNMAVQFIVGLMVPIMNIEAIEIVINPEGVITNEDLLEHEQSRNHPAAIEGAQGMIPLATQAMVDEGTDHTSALTPKTAGSAFARQQHEHEIGDVLWLQEALDEKLPVTSYRPRTDSLNNQQGEVADIRNKDMNTCKAGEFGLYEKATCANSPPNAGTFYYCETKSTYATMETIQFAFGYDHSQGVMAWRSLMTAATPQAGPWREVFDTDNPPASSDIEGLEEALDGKLNKAAEPCPHNLDAATESGFYVQSTFPTGSDYLNFPVPQRGALTVLNGGSGPVQLYMTNDGPTSQRLYYRAKYYDTWGTWASLYDTDHKPTSADIGAAPASHTHPPEDVGAAPASHTHTAAQGNQDIVTGGHSQVGTYALGLWGGGGGNRAAGAVLSGGSLNFSTCEGELTGGNMPGTWKLLGALVGEGDYGVWNTSLFIRVA